MHFKTKNQLCLFCLRFRDFVKIITESFNALFEFGEKWNCTSNKRLTFSLFYQIGFKLKRLRQKEKCIDCRISFVIKCFIFSSIHTIEKTSEEEHFPFYSIHSFIYINWKIPKCHDLICVHTNTFIYL